MADLVTILSSVDSMRGALANMLPKHIPYERYRATIEAALRNTPDMVQADALSLNTAITQAAEDGMLPDGRQGIITVYNEKRIKKGKGGQPDQEFWIKVAKWTPMLLGITERANSFGIMIDAQVVCEHDDIEVVLGTDPRITHKLNVKKPRGKMVGVYAVFFNGSDGSPLHVEYMDAGMVEAVKTCSKNPKGLLWTKFEDQAWCKTVIRRAAKRIRSLPSQLLRAIERDDDLYSFNTPSSNAPRLPAPEARSAPSLPPSIADIEAREAKPEKATAPPPPTTRAPEDSVPAEPSAEDRFLVALDQKLGACTTLKAAQQIWARNENTIENKLDHDARQAAFAMWDKHENRLKKAA